MKEDVLVTLAVVKTTCPGDDRAVAGHRHSDNQQQQQQQQQLRGANVSYQRKTLCAL